MEKYSQKVLPITVILEFNHPRFWRLSSSCSNIWQQQEGVWSWIFSQLTLLWSYTIQSLIHQEWGASCSLKLYHLGQERWIPSFVLLKFPMRRKESSKLRIIFPILQKWIGSVLLDLIELTFTGRSPHQRKPRREWLMKQWVTCTTEEQLLAKDTSKKRWW